METKFFNRELSWIEFNSRVLFQGLNKKNPLMERLQFLTIVTSNFNEFFQVRVASTKRLLNSNPKFTDSSGLNPKELLSAISTRCHELIKKQNECLINDVLPEFAKKGFEYISPKNYSLQQAEYIQNLFKSDIFPLLTPLRTDTEQFPHIQNLAIYAAFLLKPIKGIKTEVDALKSNNDQPLIAFVEIPENVSHIYWLPTNNKSKKQFTYIDDIIQTCGTTLFPGFDVQESMIFKVTRDADFAVDEDAGQNFIHAMEDVLIMRKSSFLIQMTCTNSSSNILSFLKDKLELSEEDIYIVPEFVDPCGLMELRSIDTNNELSYEPWEHFYPATFPKDEPFWDELKIHDKLLHVPYESYEPVVKFLNDAADDKNVLTIKMTLYRTGRDSPIISALKRAAQNGKQVIVLVELKARFDEERNIAWASELENAGVTVIYGLVNLKVHAKILMVLRREADTIRRYVHLATGNYNTKTANLYSDLSLFTSNPEITNDATLFFNLVTGYSNLMPMKKLGMAPVTLKSKLLSMIQREAERSTKDNPGLIIAKMNSLTHEEIINALYKANNAGVKILLNVRGICTLVPGIPGMSENIQVISIVDRYLEHSRIFYFQNAGSPELYCSSADWMPRNLDRRIELMFPILDADVFKEVKDILLSYFKDNTNAQSLLADGNWEPVKKEKKDDSYRTQQELYNKYKQIEETKLKGSQIEFNVRRK